MEKQSKRCMLRPERPCVGCGECTRCDLDPNKLCDNCMKCVTGDAEYRAIRIDKIIIPEADASASETTDAADGAQAFDMGSDEDDDM